MEDLDDERENLVVGKLAHEGGQTTRFHDTGAVLSWRGGGGLVRIQSVSLGRGRPRTCVGAGVPHDTEGMELERVTNRVEREDVEEEVEHADVSQGQPP